MMEDDDTESIEAEEEDYEEDDDIYGDLDEDIFGAHPSPSKRTKTDIVEDSQYQSLLQENEDLKALVANLKYENETYAKNISSLFRTAKNEVEKKNFIIKNLTTKLKNVTLSKSTLSTSDAEAIMRNCQEALHEAEAAITLDEIRKCIKNDMPNRVSRKKRKLIKCENMSFYFFKEQGSFERLEEVEFPKKSKSNSNERTDNPTSTTDDLPSSSSLRSRSSEKNSRSKSDDGHQQPSSSRSRSSEKKSSYYSIPEKDPDKRVSYRSNERRDKTDKSHRHNSPIDKDKDRPSRRASNDERTRSGNKDDDRRPLNSRDKERAKRQDDSDRSRNSRYAESRSDSHRRRSQRNRSRSR